MTNGDKFLEVWPNTDVKFDYDERIVDVGISSGFTAYTPIDMDWWEDEYVEVCK